MPLIYAFQMSRRSVAFPFKVLSDVTATKTPGNMPESTMFPSSSSVATCPGTASSTRSALSSMSSKDTPRLSHSPLEIMYGKYLMVSFSSFLMTYILFRSLGSSVEMSSGNSSTIVYRRLSLEYICFRPSSSRYLIISGATVSFIGLPRCQSGRTLRKSRLLCTAPCRTVFRNRRN